MTKLLEIKNIDTFYHRIPMLMNVSMEINAGEVCCVLGTNGAGKTTLVNSIVNMVRKKRGSIFFESNDITNWPTHKIIEAGIAIASASVGTFPKMSVETNLRIGGFYINDPAVLAQRLDEIYQSFPILRDRLHQKAGTLSGGERTMLSIARAVINKPHLLIMDEPSLGLAPIMVEEVFKVIKHLRDEGMSIMLVEQNAVKALSVAKSGYVIQKGQIIFQGTKEELEKSEFMENPVV